METATRHPGKPFTLAGVQRPAGREKELDILVDAVIDLAAGHPAAQVTAAMARYLRDEIGATACEEICACAITRLATPDTERPTR